MIMGPMATPCKQGKKRCFEVIKTTHLIDSIRSGVDCYISPHMGGSQYISIGRFSELTALTPLSTTIYNQGHHQNDS